MKLKWISLEYTVTKKGTWTKTIMGKTAQVCLVLICQFGLSKQLCPECTCCKNGSIACDSNNTCTEGCIAGYYGVKCTEDCLQNCKTCVNDDGCTECERGFYTTKCSLQCGKGCQDKTCLISSGQCSCKSVDFVNDTCDTCSGNRYGDECNNTCLS
ncbi:cell death abnormality protein 1-like [Ruditapes philippinarum]|uniref:cell death abnormality protein 1-like n=1 Tax=Ruditapes philippinarum TaxID=129788 RepID=UPI00295A9863|nr:cell death abnormality protein 1-like [Ruditapes philippinarum]